MTSRLIPSLVAATALAVLPGFAAPAKAADDYGVISTVSTGFEVSSPAVTEFKGRTMMYMSGSNGIFFSGETKDGWTDPQYSFGKPGYTVRDPSIVKHPRSNQYYMFYTMTKKTPDTKVMVDRKSGKRTTVTIPAKNGIGVAYAVSCTDSPDKSGLCWQDISKDKPFIAEQGKTKGGSAPSVHLNGAKAIIYYTTNPPEGKLVRSIVDIRDWKVEETRPLTFQSFDHIRKTWNTASPSMSAGVSNVDVQPYGKGYLMVGNDGSFGAISRWKSKNGINFYYDPYDGGKPIVLGGLSSVTAPVVQPVSSNEFRLYYAFGDANSTCSKTRRSYGSLIPCRNAVQVRAMSEEKNPKIMDNFYFDKAYKKPDYDSVEPMPDSYSLYAANPEKYPVKMPDKLPKKKGQTAPTPGKEKSPSEKDEGGFFDRLFR